MLYAFVPATFVVAIFVIEGFVASFAATFVVEGFVASFVAEAFVLVTFVV